MNMQNLDVAMKDYFTKIGIDPITFSYNERKNQFISDTSFINSEDDLEQLYIIIKLHGVIGTVVIGSTVDGISFYEQEMLGQILLLDDKWINIF